MYTVVVLDEDEGEDDLWGEGGCIVVNDPSVYKLFISDEGYAVLKIGPFMDGYDGLPGINVTIHLKNNNISALTGTTGFAVFYITFPVIYDLYEVTTEYGGKTATSEIYLEVSVDGLKYLGYSTVSSEILEKGYEYLKITEDLSKEWSERKILEYVNAIKNFGLINGNYKVQKNIFINSALGNKLSDEDLQDFKDIFFEFFRFKEIATWYLISDSKKQLDINEVTIQDLIEKSRLMYAIKEGKFFNKFLFSLEDVSKVYVIPPKDSHLMRFIEVFYKRRMLGDIL